MAPRAGRGANSLERYRSAGFAKFIPRAQRDHRRGGEQYRHGADVCDASHGEPSWNTRLRDAPCRSRPSGSETERGRDPTYGFRAICHTSGSELFASATARGLPQQRVDAHQTEYSGVVALRAVMVVGSVVRGSGEATHFARQREGISIGAALFNLSDFRPAASLITAKIVRALQPNLQRGSVMAL